MKYALTDGSLLNIETLSLTEIGQLQADKKDFISLCNHKVFIKAGSFNKPHFSHYPSDSSCVLEGSPESELHLYWKHRICVEIPNNNNWIASEEVASLSKNIRVDVEAINEKTKEKICFEYQKSPLSLGKFIERSRDRKAEGYSRVIWFVPEKFSIPQGLWFTDIFVITDNGAIQCADKVWASDTQLDPILTFEFQDGISLILDNKVMGINKHWDQTLPRYTYITTSIIKILSEFEPLIVPRTERQYENWYNGTIWTAKADFFNYKLKTNKRMNLYVSSGEKPATSIGMRYWSPRYNGPYENVLQNAPGWNHVLYRGTWPLDEVKEKLER